MCARKKVLTVNNGNLNSKVLFIAEAPGRLGAECTGIPLYGDKTGDNFETLLGNIGWERTEVFITNAVLCNPQDDKGNNATPTKEEIENCSYYLEMTLELLNPDVVVTLGVRALEALQHIEKHNFILKDCVARELPWNGRHLFPLYHMGPRATIHRAIAKQRADFIKLSHFVDPTKGLKRQPLATQQRTTKSIGTNLNNTLLNMTWVIVSELKTISFFKLTKLIYMIDYVHFKEFGTSLSGSIYLRMQDGPCVPTLKNIIKEHEGKLFITAFNKKKPIISRISDNYKSNLNEKQKKIIYNIINKYIDSTDAAVKIAVYRTDPMQYILEQEKKGRNMTKVPVLYKDKSVIEMDKL